MYCGICGAPVSQPVQSRRERLLFFLTPLFLVLFCVALSYELGVSSPEDSGLLFAGALVFAFIGAAGIFALLVWLFSLPVLPVNYWQAGFFGVSQALVCGLLLYHLEILLLGEALHNIGPIALMQARAEMFGVIYLPSLLVGLLSVSARARVVRFPESVSSPVAAFLLKHAVTLIPVLVLALSVIMHFSPPEPARSLVQARILYDLDATGLSASVAEKALQSYPDYAPLHYIRGVAIIDGQHSDFAAGEATAHLEKAVKLEPQAPLFYFRLSSAYDLERRGAEAIAAAASAAALLPEDAYLWQHLGDLHLKYRDYAGAARAFRNSLKYVPTNPVVLNNLAYTLLELNEDLPQALEMARMSTDSLPGMIFNLDTLAWALYKNKIYAEALEIMNTIFQGRSEVSPEVDFHYAMILHANGMLKKPLQTFDTLLARPEVAADHNLFGQIYEARSEVAERLGTEIAVPDQDKPVNGEAAGE